MQKISRLVAIVFVLLIFSTSCDVVQQVQQMGNLSKCSFRLQSVEHLTLAGVDVQNVKKVAELNLFDAGKLANAVASRQFLLEFTLNLEARNPNPAPAGMTRIDWILLIDDVEMTRGVLDKAVTIPANNGVATIAMQMQMDLKQVLSGKSADAILNFGLNLAGVGNKPSRFTLRMKPTLNVGGFPITYPGYLNVKTDFTGM